MKEVSFKYILILVLINIFCFAESINPNSYNFIFNNFTPDSNYKNNIGIQLAFKESYKSFHTQNWISDNLYLGGMFNLRNNNIKLNYSLNLGYKVKNKIFNTYSVIYDFGIYNQRVLSDIDEYKNSKWKKISILFSVNNFFSLSYNYLYSKCSNEDVNNSIKGCNNSNDNKDAKFITFDFFNYIKNNYILNFGIKKNGTLLYPYLSFWYSL